MARPTPSQPPLPAPAAPPLVPEGAAFDGLLTFRGTTRVEGELTGRVLARGRLELGPRSRVRARIDVDELCVEGELEGELRARRRAELRPSARVRGGLDAPRVTIAEGALLEGRCCTGPTASSDTARPSGEPRAARPASGLAPSAGPTSDSP